MPGAQSRNPARAGFPCHVERVAYALRRRPRNRDKRPEGRRKAATVGYDFAATHLVNVKLRHVLALESKYVPPPSAVTRHLPGCAPTKSNVSDAAVTVTGG